MSGQFPTEISCRLEFQTDSYQFPHQSEPSVSRNLRAAPLANIIETLKKLTQHHRECERPATQTKIYENAHFALRVLHSLLTPAILQPKITISETGDLTLKWLRNSITLEMRFLQPNNVTVRMVNLSTGEDKRLYIKNDFSEVTALINKYFTDSV